MLAPALSAPFADDLHTGTGLHVVVSPLATTPMVHAHLAVPLRITDLRALAAADVMTAAWADHPACRRIERAGGTTALTRRQHWVVLTLSCQRATLPLLWQALNDVLAGDYDEPAVAAARAACCRQSTLIAAQPAVASQLHLWDQVYGETPDALRPALPLPVLDAVTPTDVQHAHATQVSPTGSHLLLVGDIDIDVALTTAAAELHTWRPAADPPAAPVPTLRPGPPAVAVHPASDLAATHVRLAAASFPRHHPEAFTSASIASLVLGGNFSARLNRLLRETHGLAYRTTSSLVDSDERTFLAVEADVTNGRADDALALIGNVLDDLAATGPTRQELCDAVGYTLGTYQLTLGTQLGRAQCLLSYLMTGLRLTDVETLPERLTALTTADVRDVFTRYRPESFWGAVTGPVDGHLTRGGFTCA